MLRSLAWSLVGICLLTGSGKVGAVEEGPGSPKEPVRYIGKEKADTRYHDGRLRPVVGVQSYQVTRANRTHPERAEGVGWTYNHAPMLAYWEGRFYLEYLSNPVDEEIPPGQTLLVTSRDGIHWEPPQILFPVYTLPDGSTAIMHQRMGFYIAPNKRLLALGFVGLFPKPWDGTGVGRIVREVYKDGRFGPIYFIRYNSHHGWSEKNTHYPLYTASKDTGFMDACNALLADKLMTMQWWEEDRSTDGFYTTSGFEAPSFYHRKDGKVVGLWKWANGALSEDEGKSWSPIVKLPSLIMDGAKVWGQRTKDGRYALVFNPNPLSDYRWPLGIMTSEDGILFDHLSLVHGEVPPRRFRGRWKDFGPQYVRGMEEGNGDPPGEAMWVCYSVNKEDMWVSRIPIPVRTRVESPVNDTFDAMETNGFPTDWNIYSPQWCPVRVVEFPSATNKSLELQDRDPYNYARAVRLFPESQRATINVKVLARQTNTGRLDVEVMDGSGNRPIRIVFGEDGQIRAQDGRRQVRVQPYAANTWHDLQITLDVAKGVYSLAVDGKSALTDARFASKVASVERLSFRTGPHTDLPRLSTPTEPGEDVINPNPDDPVALAVYHVDDVRVTPQP